MTSVTRFVRGFVPGAYRLRYWRLALRRRATALAPADDRPDIAFVVAPRNTGWILDRLAGELALARGRRATVVYTDDGSGCDARALFFTHWLPYLNALARGNARPSAVYVTHLPTGVDLREIVFALGYASAIVCMNAATVVFLRELGIDQARILAAPGAADPELFRSADTPHPSRVLVSAAYYPRKAPDVLLAVVDRCPETEFLLVGVGWERWDRYRELVSRTNFR